MKITRHTAKDMRQALRLVREQLGPEAVIMTSRRIQGGVEVTAAIDFDAEQFDAQAAPPAEVRPFHPEEFTPPPSAPPRPEVDPYTVADLHQSAYSRVRAAVEAEAAHNIKGQPESDFESRTSAELEAEIDSFMAATDASGSTAPSSAIPQSLTQATDEMGTELKNLRRILETQLAQLAWNDLTRRAPIHTEILRELTEIGLAQDFAAQVVAQLPAGSTKAAE
jgi:flagellar biosynthesis protein FlhF